MRGIHRGTLTITANTSGQATVTTLTKCTQFEQAGTGGRGVTEDYTNNKLTIQSAGLYRIFFNVSVDYSAEGMASIQVYKNGSAIADTLREEDIAVNGERCSVACEVFANLEAGDYLELYVGASASATVIVTNGVLGVESVSPQGI